MEKKLLKIGMLTVVLIFVFTGASWADGRKNRHHSYAPEKRIRAKHQGVAKYHQPVHYKHKMNRQHKRLYKRHYYRHRPAHRYRHHKFDHRHHYRYDRYYGENSYDDDDPSYNEFSIAATISEPGMEFSIGTKRTW